MKKYFIIIFIVLFFGVLAVLFLPVFNMQKLVVSGNNYVSYDDICDTINFSVGKNIFLFNKLAAKKNLLHNYFISDVRIKTVLPNTLSVEIKERIPCCYLKYLNDSFVLIDNNGFIIEVVKTCDKDFPLITGVNFKKFVVGKTLEAENTDSLNDAMSLSEIITRNKIQNVSVLVDITNVNDIHLYVKNIDVVFGDMTNCERKVALLKSILDSKSVYLEKSGTLSLKNPSSATIFKFIT